VHKKNGIASKPAVQPDQSNRGRGLRCEFSASLRKDRTFPITKLQCAARLIALRAPSTMTDGPGAHARRRCPRPAMSPKRHWSGFRTSPLRLLRRVQFQDRSPVGVGTIVALDRRLSPARTFPPDPHFANATPPLWPECEFRHRFLNLC
jgi:hypothetical protein